MAPNSQSKAASRGSPLRKGTSSKLTSKSNKGAQFILEAYGFPPTGVEAYCYTRVVDGIQQYEGYTYPFRKYVEGTSDSQIVKDILQKGNFMASYYQRSNKDDNERKVGADNWPRYWMIRNLEGGQASSEASRQEGMDLLKAFFKNHGVTKYPPQDITMRDLTGNPPATMDRFFMDGDIIRLLEAIIDEDLLNTNFASEFPDYAAVIFGGPSYPADAVDRLGFGPKNPRNGPNGSYDPNFVPPGVVSNGSSASHNDPDGKNESDNPDDAQDNEQGEAQEQGHKRATRGGAKKK